MRAHSFLFIRTNNVKFLQFHFRPIEIEIQRSIVLLGYIHPLDESFNLNLCDLSMRLQLEFNAKEIKVQARNLMFLCVCPFSPSDEFNYLKGLKQYFQKHRYHNFRVSRYL